MSSDQQKYNTSPDVLETFEKKPSLRRRRRRRSRSPMEKMVKRIQKRLKFTNILLGIVVLLIVLGIGLAVVLVDAFARFNSELNDTNLQVNNLAGRDISSISYREFTQLHDNIRELTRAVNSLQARSALLMPIANRLPDAEANLEMLDAANELLIGADLTLAGAEPIISYVALTEEDDTDTRNIPNSERLVELLQLGDQRFNSARENLNNFEALIADIDLANVSEATLLNVRQLETIYNQVNDINRVLLGLPDLLDTLLGLDDPSSFIVLSQNNDELRPSGGYISTYGWLLIDQSKIDNYFYAETTVNTPNPPPDDFANTFEVPDWWISYSEPLYAAWDGSWYADFPSTAELAMSYYNAGGNPHSPVDGVIAIDVTGFELLMEAIGEVTVPEFGRTVTSDDFRDVIYEVRGNDFGEHNRFLVAMYSSLFSKWQTIDEEQTPQLVEALLSAMQSRHILIHFADDELNELAELVGWNGKQIAADNHDYLMIVDANIAGNKVNQSVIRETFYDVTIRDDGALDSRLSIAYDYAAINAQEDPGVTHVDSNRWNYHNILQVFLPASADITTVRDLDEYEINDIGTHTHFVAQHRVSYDTSERYQLTYETDAVVESIGDYRIYRLLVQKQPGLQATNTNVQIRLPEGTTVIDTIPELVATYELEQPIIDFEFVLESDQWVEVVYKVND